MKKLVSFISFLLIISSQVCAQWQQLNSPVLPVNDILKLSNGTILIGTGNGLFTSNDNFLSWDSTSISGNVNLIQKDNFGNIYASVLSSDFYNPGYVFRSTDFGSTWNIPYDSIPGSPYNVQNIFINDSGFVFTIQRHGDYDGMYTTALKSTDIGSTWTLIWYSFCACNGTTLGSSIIENLSGTLFVSELFILYPQYSLSYSIRKIAIGGNWTLIAQKFANNMYVYNNELYMATTSVYSTSLGLIKSSDDGNTFEQLNNGFSDLDVQQLILRPEVFIALNGDGIYRSFDEGNNWVRLDHTGLNPNINRIYMDDNQILYACTDNGIYFFTGILDVRDKISQMNFSLSQNYPNPFNPSTKISWQSPVGSWQTLKVYDVLGKEVVTLVDEYRDAGNYEVDFNAVNFASGIYYYQLKAGDYIGTKKMILMK